MDTLNRMMTSVTTYLPKILRAGIITLGSCIIGYVLCKIIGTMIFDYIKLCKDRANGAIAIIFSFLGMIIFIAMIILVSILALSVLIRITQ